MVLNKEVLQVKPVVLHVIETYQALATKKNITTHLEIEDKLSVNADKNCLKTVLSNIYSNAIKFSHNSGYIHIIAKNEANKTTIQIKDEGVGINKEQLNRLFKIDKTTSTVGTDNEKGTGFGLLISKELMELHNGTIHVSSNVGKGAIITLVF